MLVADGVRGNVYEDDELHDAYHDHEESGTLERVVVDRTTRRRSRFRTTTESGTDLGVVVGTSEGLAPGDVLAVDDADERLFVVEFEQEDAVVVELPDGGDTEALAAAVAFGHLVGNKHWDLAVDGGAVYVRVGADGHRVADELEAELLDGATLRHERVDPTLFDASPGGHEHTHGDERDHTHSHDHGGHGHSHGDAGHSHPVSRPTEGRDD